MTTTALDTRRINKREFISRVAQRSGLSVKAVTAVYGAIIDELMEAVSCGETVVLTGFGRFYRQAHKGHKVRFGKKDVDDYSVLKFSAARGMNRALDDPEDLDLLSVNEAFELYLSDEEPLELLRA